MINKQTADVARIDRIAVHVIALPAVIVIPPLVYDAFYHSSWISVPGIPFIGGLTYPAYALFCLSGLKRPRLRFILAYLVGLATLAFAIACGTNHATSEIVFALPAAMGVFPLLLAAGAFLLGKRPLALTGLICSLIATPLGAGVSFMLLMGKAMSGMRW